MNDRDRLINELKKAKNRCLIQENGGCLACKYRGQADCTLENLADRLLENGVIVPPCKVGDVVYLPWIWNDEKGVAILTVTHIIIDGLHAYIKTDFNTDDEEYYNAYSCGRFNFNEFEKIVFTNIKEAEAKLKERKGK